MLFIDARKLGRMVDRARKELADDNIARIATTHHAWRGEQDAGEYADIAGFCRSAPLEAVVDADVKGHIQAAQTRAVMAVNGELVRLYWDIGRIIAGRQRREGWGAAVIPRLALKLKNELPALKGFSERNIKRMLAFHRDYPDPMAMGQQPVAQLPASAKVPPPAAQLIASPKVPQAVAQFAFLRPATAGVL